MTAPVYGIGAHLRFLMLQSAQVVAIAGQRIHPGTIPQRSTFPAVSYAQISSERTSVMGADTGTVRSIWQVDAYAQTYGDARRLASEIRKALERKEGLLPTATGGAIIQRRIQGVFVEADTDMFEDPTQLHRVSTDYVIWYDETGE